MKVLGGCWVTLKTPSENWPLATSPDELEVAPTISTTPWRASTIVPSGRVAPAASVLKRCVPGISTVIRPDTGASAGRRAERGLAASCRS